MLGSESASSPMSDAQASVRGTTPPALSDAMLLTLASAADPRPEATPAGTEAAQVLSMTPDPGIPSIPLRAYRYTPNPVQETEAEATLPPQQQRLVDLNLAGDYGRLGREGLALMKREKLSDELRLIVANGLAWSGRLRDAEQVYRSLLDTPSRADAQVALANIQRWQGKNWLAASAYREVLAANPEHEEARKGLELVEKSTRPRLRIETVSSGDYGRITSVAQPAVPQSIITQNIPGETSPAEATPPPQPVITTYATRTRTFGSRVNSRWATDGGLREWEVEASTMRANLPGVSASQALVTGRVQAHDMPFDPALEVSLGDSIYLRGSMQIGKSPFRVHGGNVNWGQMSFNARALDERLSALNIGIDGNSSTRFGSFGLMLDHYQVSDGNQVQTGLFRYSPPFKLFSRHLRPVFGIEHRKTRFASPAYWSPDEGYGLAYAGVEAEWSHDRWDLSASLQRGWRLYGEAGPSWGAAIAGRYDFDDHWTAGARAWFVRNQREQAPYRAGVITLFVERRW